MPAEVVELFARSGLCLREGGIVQIETPPRRGSRVESAT
jgi:hypothetical protein